MHRPDSDAALAAVMLCNAMGVPVWADFDDCIMSVPGRNPFARSTDKQVHQQRLVEILSKVQAVTVSTAAVKEQFAPFNPNTFIIPNAFPKEFYSKFTVNPRTDDTVRICWRGSDSQVMNLRMLSPTIIQTIEKYPNVHWVLHAGQSPFYLIESVPADRLTVKPWKAIPDVFVSLMETSPDIGVVCLFDDLFDKGRSPTVAYEMATTNTALVMPHWYDIPGVLNYTPGDLGTRDISRHTDKDLQYASGDIFEKVCDAIELTKEDRLSRAAQTQAFVKEHCDLDRVNEWRWKFLKQVVQCTTHKIRLNPL
jgi:hypothetical protein